MLIDCLNPLPINTPGSLCDAYPSRPTPPPPPPLLPALSTAGRRRTGWGTSHQALSKPQHCPGQCVYIMVFVAFLWVFLLTVKTQSRMKCAPRVDNRGTLTQTHTHTHTHMQAHTRSLFLCLSVSLFLSVPHTHTLTHTSCLYEL